jgi:hypothetical protein
MLASSTTGSRPVDGEGQVLLSRKVANDQSAITGVLGELKAMAAGWCGRWT